MTRNLVAQQIGSRDIIIGSGVIVNKGDFTWGQNMSASADQLELTLGARSRRIAIQDSLEKTKEIIDAASRFYFLNTVFRYLSK